MRFGLDKGLATFALNFGKLLWQWPGLFISILESVSCFSNFAMSFAEDLVVW